MNVLLTNDDGIQATGLHAMRRALLELPGIQVEVIAPDANRSASSRSITTRRPLWVEEVEFGDGTKGFATDGTPVDCVRFAALGLIESVPDLILSGINHGANLGDDITYSGTVAAAFEGIVLGIPAIAVSQQSDRRALDYRAGGGFEFDQAAAFAARLVAELEEVPMPDETLLNVNCPAGEVRGVRVCRLGKRRYNDRLELVESDRGGRRYRIYGMDPTHALEADTDLTAIAEGYISVTPLHLDLTDRAGLDALAEFDLERLLRPAAKTVD